MPPHTSALVRIAVVVAFAVSACGGTADRGRPTIGEASKVCEAYGRANLPGLAFMAVSLESTSSPGVRAPRGTFQCVYGPADLRTSKCAGLDDMRPCTTTVMLDSSGAVRTPGR